ncbi:MAG: hypothetical protein J2P18_16285 [Nocardia sp.]|nr:hypothetical protein [Nocardia sp.]
MASSPSPSHCSSSIYAYARRHPHLLAEHLDRAEAARIGRRFVAGPVCYLIGTLVGLISVWAGIAVFAALIAFYWLPVGAHEQHRVR